MTEVYIIIPAAFADMGMRDATGFLNEESEPNGVRYIVEESPEGWETKALAMIREQDFAIRKEVFRTLGTAFTTFVENPYNEDNMLRINSEEWLQLIKMFKRWFDEGYTNVQVLQDPLPGWQKGAIGIDSHSWIRLGRAAQGAEKVNGVVPPKTDASNPKRTWVHLDSGFVFVDAPHPQEGLEWLLAVLGPKAPPATATGAARSLSLACRSTKTNTRS